MNPKGRFTLQDANKIAEKHRMTRLQSMKRIADLQEKIKLDALKLEEEQEKHERNVEKMYSVMKVEQQEMESRHVAEQAAAEEEALTAMEAAEEASQALELARIQLELEKKRKDDELQAQLIAQQAEKDLKERELADQKKRRGIRKREREN